MIEPSELAQRRQQARAALARQVELTRRKPGDHLLCMLIVAGLLLAMGALLGLIGLRDPKPENTTAIEQRVLDLERRATISEQRDRAIVVALQEKLAEVDALIVRVEAKDDRRPDRRPDDPAERRR